MIISITGKPCSGKGTVGKIFCNKYNFKYMCTGDMFREIGEQMGYKDILSFNSDTHIIKSIDEMVDNRTKEIGQSQLQENIVFDSRLAWHFIPQSFKVFIDVDLDIAAERLLDAKRNSEEVKNIKEARRSLKKRWDTENTRYNELYNIDNTNLNNYNLVIDSSNFTPEEIADMIYVEYSKVMQQA